MINCAAKYNLFRVYVYMLIILFLIYIGYNMHYNRDIIGTRKPNPKKTLPYVVAGMGTYAILMLSLFTNIW